jgi:hypothetical protein
MHRGETHISDQELQQAVDGELAERDTCRIEKHLATCWSCRTRRQELEGAIGDFVRLYQEKFDPQLPPAVGPRALLKAHLAAMKFGQAESPALWNWGLAAAALVLFILGMLMWRFHLQPPTRVYAMSVPNPTLTPGATVLVSQGEICRESLSKNKSVPAALEKTVFDVYGIPSSQPQSYEIDYLITPALGGADDIHNLWPQPYSTTVWNARVKDELEDYLHAEVCDGRLDLAMAQREIAGNWVEAYKKYFHTDKPLNRRDNSNHQ